MNVFLPYSNFNKCAEVLDDKRLTKQILECKQIVSMIEKKKSNPDYKNPYLNHPVVQHYFHSVDFICMYALVMCREFKHRFNHEHTYKQFFEDFSPTTMLLKSQSIVYVSGSKYSSYYIRETREKEVHRLFKEKLIDKWEKDRETCKSLKWTNRSVPLFYTQYLNMISKLSSKDIFNELKKYMTYHQKMKISSRIQFYLDNDDFIFYDLHDELNRVIRENMPDVYSKFIKNEIKKICEKGEESC